MGAAGRRTSPTSASPSGSLTTETGNRDTIRRHARLHGARAGAEEESRQAHAAAEIYSLGVVLYELLTTKVPVPGATVGQFLQRLWSRSRSFRPKFARGVHRGLETSASNASRNDRAAPLRVRRGILRVILTAYARASRRSRAVPRARSASSVGFAATRRTSSSGNRSGGRGGGRGRCPLDHLARPTAGAGAHPRQQRVHRERSGRRSAVSAPRDRRPCRRDVAASGGAALLGARRGPTDRHRAAAAGRHPRQRVRHDPPMRTSSRNGRRPADQCTSVATRSAITSAARAASPRRGRPAPTSRAPSIRSHDELGFAISTPVLDERGTQSLFVGTLSAKSAFGAVRMEASPQSGRIITALIGPRGNNRTHGPDAAAPSDFAFLVHPGMDRGVEYPVRAPEPAVLRQRFGLSCPARTAALASVRPSLATR